MAEKTIPWWRRALNYALDGIRTGFGLFPRHTDPEPGNKLDEESKLVPYTNEKLEENTELTSHSPNPETIEQEPEKLAEPEEVLETVPVAMDVSEVGSAEGNAEETNTAPEDAAEEVAAGEGVWGEVPETAKAPVREPEGPANPGPDIEPEIQPETPPAIDPEPETPPVSEPEPDPEDAPAPVKGFEAVSGEEPGPWLAAEEETESEVSPIFDSILGDALVAESEPEVADSAIEPVSVVEPEAVPVPEVILNSEPAEKPLEAETGLTPPPPELAAESEPQADSEPTIEPVTAAVAPEPPPAFEPAAAISGIAEPATVAAIELAPAAGIDPPFVLTSKPPIKVESRDDNADLSPFSVIVDQVYDGPLDLLLDLIRKQDIDIYDIPIAKITAQFLTYVNQLKAGDVDVAGEFIYIASLLIHIKSKMLLPRAPAGPEEAAEDPRRELVERLLEHERFKNAAQMLQQKQMLEAATWSNPGVREFKDDAAAEPEIAADTVDLVRIFRDIIERARKRPVFNVDEDAVTVGQMIQFLARRLTMEDKPVALRRLLSHTRSERALIAMFLALLELVRLQAILLRQDLAFSEIFIKKHTGFDAVMDEGLSNARDDWR